MSQLHTVAIIQARMSASRLPGKVMMDLAGEPMLVRVVDRTRRAKTIEEVIVATTIDHTDDDIETLCIQRGYLCYRGSSLDVLDRYYQAARLFHADVIVRVTADCPIIDPTVIDKIVNQFLYNNSSRSPIADSPIDIRYDFAANRLPPPGGRTYPIGLDTEVCSFQALELAWHEAVLPHQREHVMPFFYEQPERFRILHVTHDPDYGDLRWTVDTPEDLELMRQIYEHFSDKLCVNDHFSWLEVLKLFDKHPELARINAQIQPKHYREIDTRREK